MDLFIRDLNLGVMPKEYYENSIEVPERQEKNLSSLTETAERILFRVFLKADEQLFSSLIGIIKSYSSLDDYEIEEIQESKEGKEDFAFLLSNFEKYYFCKDGISVGVWESFPKITYNFLVGESILHVYELDGNKSTELGVILLSDSTVRELVLLHRKAIEWVGGEPLYTFYDNSNRKRIYSKNS